MRRRADLFWNGRDRSFGPVVGTVKESTKKLFRRLGYDIRRYQRENDELLRLAHSINVRNVGAVLDVGANTGQFAAALRRGGYAGLIVSFEPLSEAHAQLLENAKADPSWHVSPRCAVGASAGSVTLNVAGNSVSSSVLSMLDVHVASAPGSAYVGREQADLISVDEYVAKSPELRTKALALKADVQGYEDAVIRGSNQSLSQTEVIYLEMSLTPLYQGGPDFIELYSKVESLGYRCISIVPGFTDKHTFEVLQVNAIFVRAGT